MHPSLRLLITKGWSKALSEGRAKSKTRDRLSQNGVPGPWAGVGEASTRLKLSQCSLFNTRLRWLLIFLAIFTCPANFHIFGWLLSPFVPTFTLYSSFSFHLSPPGSLQISFPLPFFSFPVYKLISSWALSHCYMWKKHDPCFQHLIYCYWHFISLQSPSICLFRSMEFLGHGGLFLQL